MLPLTLQTWEGPEIQMFKTSPATLAEESAAPNLFRTKGGLIMGRFVSQLISIITRYLLHFRFPRWKEDLFMAEEGVLF